MKYADNLVLLSEEEAIQGMTDRPLDTGICYGMDMNVENTKVMAVSKQPSTVRSAINTTQLESVKYYNYWGCVINYARCTREIISRIAKEKQHSVGIKISSLAYWN
jgi:hypothetical protein